MTTKLRVSAWTPFSQRGPAFSISESDLLRIGLGFRLLIGRAAAMATPDLSIRIEICLHPRVGCGSGFPLRLAINPCLHLTSISHGPRSREA
ncbi:hypothetical protein EDC02_7626 [Micromonospora sp. Llam0]|nr:hypothetical protein EDC02_7626 [Micromonospora sp. Llam0]